MAAGALTAMNEAVLDPKCPTAVPGESVVGAGLYDPCTAEVAECTCPDFCERDHTNE